MSLVVAAPAAGKCRLVEQKRRVEKRVDGACTARLFTAQVVDRRSKVKVELKAEELRCGAVKLGSWARIKKLGLQTCRDNARSEMKQLDYDESFKVTLLLGRLLGVDAWSGGYTGGAHGTAHVKRRTYDVKTGRELTLQQLYPKQHARLLARTRKKFEAHKQRDDYSFDARAFAPTMGKLGTGIEFAMPHEVETARGTTLKLRLLAGPPAKVYR
jgi:hypothetical protein